MHMLRSPTSDADLVGPNLWVGSRPLPGRYRWLHALVLTAIEYQPPGWAFPGITIVRAPLDDDPSRPMTREEVDAAISGGRTVARFLTAHQRVLVTCAMGLNRSALVAALAMQDAFDMSADEAIYRIREARGPVALSNPNFTGLIDRMHNRRKASDAKRRRR